MLNRHNYTDDAYLYYNICVMRANEAFLFNSIASYGSHFIRLLPPERNDSTEISMENKTRVKKYSVEIYNVNITT